jgi:hypothetical protein
MCIRRVTEISYPETDPSTFHDGLTTLSNRSLNVQGGIRWKVPESKSTLNLSDGVALAGPTDDIRRSNPQCDIHQLITAFDRQPTLCPSFSHRLPAAVVHPIS